MTGHRRLTAFAALVAALLLAGCGGADGTAAPTGSATASPRPAAKTSPDGDKTMEQVLRDLHDSAKGIGEEHVRVMEDKDAVAAKLPPCVAHGTILTREVPARAELLLLADHLQRRGWKADGTVEENIIRLSSGAWRILFAAGPVPKELAAQTGPNKGSIALSVTRVCEKLPQP